jgi:hypothetical protein
MSEPDANGWMPIETAPLYGKRIWLRLETASGPMTCIGSKPDDRRFKGWNIEPNGYWTSVTHWQPIDAALHSKTADSGAAK